MMTGSDSGSAVAGGLARHIPVLVRRVIEFLAVRDGGVYVDATFGREGALPRKTKELIMVGITCALNRPRGVKLHSERALTLGASPREVLEAIEVAAIPGGMPGLWLGVETLDEILTTKGIEFK